METTIENVYAIGDVTAVTLANGMALPKAGVFAEGQAVTVANRIAADIHKTGQQVEFDVEQGPKGLQAANVKRI